MGNLYLMVMLFMAL